MRYVLSALLGALVLALVAGGLVLALDLDVSESDHIEVPELVGGDLADAQATLEAIPLDYRVVGGTPAGDHRVMEQVPEPGSEIDPDATVTLRVP